MYAYIRYPVLQYMQGSLFSVSPMLHPPFLNSRSGSPNHHHANAAILQESLFVLQDFRHDYTTKTLQLTAKESGNVRLKFEERLRQHARASTAAKEEAGEGAKSRKHGERRREEEELEQCSRKYREEMGGGVTLMIPES